MIDMRTAIMRGHQENIERYCRLLATELTPYEREYIHKRIADERAKLERLEAEAGQREDRPMADAATVNASRMLAKTAA